ncbi:hypothetical protein YC2023_063080 [Brassica napus]
MEAIRFSNVSALLILLLLSLSLRATSKDQTVSCTMCTSCDNPCNPVPSSSPPPTPPSGGGSYYYSPPPPTPPSSGGGGSYYYPPPSTSGGGKYPPPYGDGGQSYYYPPASYGNYPMPPPPNPIVPYFPFYYHIPPPGDSGSDQNAKIAWLARASNGFAMAPRSPVQHELYDILQSYIPRFYSILKQESVSSVQD